MKKPETIVIATPRHASTMTFQPICHVIHGHLASKAHGLMGWLGRTMSFRTSHEPGRTVNRLVGFAANFSLNFENRLGFDKVIAISRWSTFWDTDERI